MTAKVVIGAFATWAAFVMAAALIGPLSSGFLRKRFSSMTTHTAEVLLMISANYALTLMFVSAYQIVLVWQLFSIGLAWVVLTSGLELLIGHYAMKRSWTGVRKFMKVESGRLYSIVLLALLVMPYVASLHIAAFRP